MVVINLPFGLIEYADSYNENINDDHNDLSHLLLSDGRWNKLNKVATKELQCILKMPSVKSQVRIVMLS